MNASDDQKPNPLVEGWDFAAAEAFRVIAERCDGDERAQSALMWVHAAFESLVRRARPGALQPAYPDFQGGASQSVLVVAPGSDSPEAVAEAQRVMDEHNSKEPWWPEDGDGPKVWTGEEEDPFHGPMIDIATVARLARAAKAESPDWKHIRYQSGTVEIDGVHADFIEAVSPEFVLGLIDRLDAAESANDTLAPRDDAEAALDRVVMLAVERQELINDHAERIHALEQGLRECLEIIDAAEIRRSDDPDIDRLTKVADGTAEADIRAEIANELLSYAKQRDLGGHTPRDWLQGFRYAADVVSGNAGRGAVEIWPTEYDIKLQNIRREVESAIEEITRRFGARLDHAIGPLLAVREIIRPIP